jgi:hypothetical protein
MFLYNYYEISNLGVEDWCTICDRFVPFENVDALYEHEGSDLHKIADGQNIKPVKHDENESEEIVNSLFYSAMIVSDQEKYNEEEEL